MQTMQNLEHPDITRCLFTGYPWPIQDEDGDDDDEDWEDEEWED